MAAAEAGSAMDKCPRCEEQASFISSVQTDMFDEAALRRCPRCGTRFTAGEREARLLFSCSSCGLPFLADKLLPHNEHTCSDCALGRLPADLPDEQLAAATEREVLLALEPRWRFVTSQASSHYLNRLVRQLAGRIKGAPGASRVVLFEDDALRTLALPSGLILLSTGTLESLENEAQLAFILGHELAHAASGEAAVRLVRLGFSALVRGRPSQGPDLWAEAALDLIRLGYGRRRERDADARSMNAMLALGYEPEAALRYLHRIGELFGSGGPGSEELSLAHPSPGYRIRKLEKLLFGRVDGAEGRLVNREVFQRALGRPVEASELVRLDSISGLTQEGRRRPSWLPWVGLAIALIVTLLLVFGFAL
jgi:hypothetical protein